MEHEEPEERGGEVSGSVEGEGATVERMAELGRLSLGAAHEINNHLTGILVFSHLLRKSAVDPVRNKLDKIVNAAERCRDIVMSLLAYAGKGPPGLDRERALLVLEELRRRAEGLEETEESRPRE